MASNFPFVSWAQGASLYEVNIRQYTQQGTFNAFKQHLPRLKNMGIDILWFMPITPISIYKRQGTLGSYYACSNYTATNNEFGSLQDLKTLVQEAQNLGFKIIIDWVANHTGADNIWAQSHPEFYLKDEEGNFTEKNGWVDVIDLDYTNIPMQNAMISAMQFWVTECNIDGFRCDMAHLVPLSFWQAARKACDSIKPLFWLAECDEAAYHSVFDVSYAWQWMHTSEKITNGNAVANDLYNVVNGYNNYLQNSKKLFFTSNHDENSWNGTEYEKYGNAAKAWAVFTCTWQNAMPLIYSGQESPNNVRLKFFDKDCIQWQQPLQLHDFYKTLLALHKQQAIQQGQVFILPTPHAQVVAFLRKHNQQVILVMLNFSADAKIKIQVQHAWLNGWFKNIFSNLQYHFSAEQNFELQAHEYLVYSTI